MEFYGFVGASHSNKLRLNSGCGNKSRRIVLLSAATVLPVLAKKSQPPILAKTPLILRLFMKSPILCVCVHSLGWHDSASDKRHLVYRQPAWQCHSVGHHCRHLGARSRRIPLGVRTLGEVGQYMQHFKQKFSQTCAFGRSMNRNARRGRGDRRVPRYHRQRAKRSENHATAIKVRPSSFIKSSNKFSSAFRAA